MRMVWPMRDMSRRVPLFGAEPCGDGVVRGVLPTVEPPLWVDEAPLWPGCMGLAMRGDMKPGVAIEADDLVLLASKRCLAVETKIPPRSLYVLLWMKTK